MKKENHILCAVQSEKTEGYFAFLQALWVGFFKAAQPLTNQSHLWAVNPVLPSCNGRTDAVKLPPPGG